MKEPLVVQWEEGRRGSFPVYGYVALNGLAASAYQTWAFRRAELMSFYPTPFRCRSGERLLMAHVRWLPPRSFGAERLAAIGTKALEGLLAQLATLPADSRKVALALCLPERMGPSGSGEARAQGKRIERALTELLEAAGARVTTHLEASGHGALGRAAIEVGWALDDRTVDAAILGGLDTCYDPAVVDGLLDAGRLFDGENLDSFVPGEGGAFLLTARRDVAARAGWRAVGRVLSAASAVEPAPLTSDEPCVAMGLTWAARRITERLERERDTLDLWIADVTHEDYRMREWTLAHPRAAAGVMRPDSAWDFLPVLLGDLGAATMPTALAVALESFLRGDPKIHNCLATGSSPEGLRGAVLLGAA